MKNMLIPFAALVLSLSSCTSVFWVNNVAIPAETVLFGEISLSGALRPVGQTENRLKEAAKLGFSQAIAPSRSKLVAVEGMSVREMPDLTAFVGDMFGAG
mgnify:CR=1 FL=1